MKFHTIPIIRFYTKYQALILFIGLPLFLFFDTCMQPMPEALPLVIFCAVLLICESIIFYVALLEKCFAWISINEKGIIFHCPFRKRITISHDHCRYIGLVYETSPMPHEYPYIYFSSDAMPEEAKEGKVKIKSKENLIYLRYTDELASYVISEYSMKTTYSLCAYYRKNKRESPRKSHKRKNN